LSIDLLQACSAEISSLDSTSRNGSYTTFPPFLFWLLRPIPKLPAAYAPEIGWLVVIFATARLRKSVGVMQRDIPPAIEATRTQRNKANLKVFQPSMNQWVSRSSHPSRIGSGPQQNRTHFIDCILGRAYLVEIAVAESQTMRQETGNSAKKGLKEAVLDNTWNHHTIKTCGKRDWGYFLQIIRLRQAHRVSSEFQKLVIGPVCQSNLPRDRPPPQPRGA
jgi:hypothetical protein